jgi:hypothetical protein
MDDIPYIANNRRASSTMSSFRLHLHNFLRNDNPSRWIRKHYAVDRGVSAIDWTGTKHLNG